MATTTDGSIWQALVDRIQVMAAEIELPLAWDGPVFDPPGNHRYIRVKFVPNINNRVLIDSDGPHQQLGLLQLSVYWTKGEFELDAREMAGLVASYFACDLKLRYGAVTVRITKRPDVADMLVEDAAIQIPVMITWECWA